MATNTNVALRQAEAFGRYGVAVTFDTCLLSAAYLALTDVGIKQAAYRQEDPGSWAMLIDSITGQVAKPLIGPHAGHYAEPF
jgi:hypothetical protein